MSTQSDEETIYYYLSWSCVDGAGSSNDKIYNKQEAIALADKEQAFANQDGNVGSYVYRVRRVWGGRRTDCVYNALTKNHSYY